MGTTWEPIRKPMPPLLQVAHHAAGGLQPVGAPPGQEHGVGPVHQVAGPEQVRLPGTRGPSPNVRRGHGAAAAHHHGAAGGGLGVGVVAHLDALDVRYGAGCQPRSRAKNVSRPSVPAGRAARGSIHMPARPGHRPSQPRRVPAAAPCPVALTPRRVDGNTMIPPAPGVSRQGRKSEVRRRGRDPPGPRGAAGPGWPVSRCGRWSGD